MNKYIILGTVIIISNIYYLSAQKIHAHNNGEFIFSLAEVEKNGEKVPSRLRFTLFFHYGRYWNFDFNNNFGLFSGMAIRNVGMTTKEDLSIEYGYNVEERKIKRRSYMLGLPLAFKLGSFDDHFYFFAGSEYELLFHYKQKIFVDGNKQKETKWFSNRTNTFLPSLFAGIQFPGGINIKFKYYLRNFLNQDYSTNINNTVVKPYENMESRIYYLSISFNFKSKKIKEYIKQEEEGDFINL